METKSIRFQWCRDIAQARRLSGIFSGNISSSYISHSELQGPRATSPSSWSEDIAKVLEADLVSRIYNPLDAPENGETMLAAALIVEGMEIGVFLVTFSRRAARPFAILEDMVVEASARSQGYGTKFIEWVSQQCRDRGITRMFLESGISNKNAHDLFEKNGFHTISIVMMREL